MHLLPVGLAREPKAERSVGVLGVGTHPSFGSRRIDPQPWVPVYKLLGRPERIQRHIERTEGLRPEDGRGYRRFGNVRMIQDCLLLQVALGARVGRNFRNCLGRQQGPACRRPR